ncbi:MAG: TorF family putative porin [Pseudomonadota bacterium]
MIKSRIAIAGALLAVTGAASAAGFSVTPTIATDYDFRGVSQTNPDQHGLDPAFQLGVNYGFENGVYLALWGSNVDFGPGDPSLEIDYTAGYAGGDAVESFGYDFGAIYYTYPSAGAGNTLEIYAGLSKGWFSGKLWLSDDYYSTGNSGYYLEGNAAIPVPSVEGLSVLAHVGMFDMQHAGSVNDYSIGVGYNVGKFATTLKYIGGSDNVRDDDSLGNHVVLAVSTTLPWAE